MTKQRSVLGILAVLAVLSGATTFTVATSAPASAGVGCYGDYCSGKDPQATGCANDAKTFASARIPGTYTYFELRWSPTCKTEWARIAAGWASSNPAALRVTQRDTGYKQVGISGSNGTTSWTRMIYSPRLCVYASWIGSPGSTGTACV